MYPHLDNHEKKFAVYVDDFPSWRASHENLAFHIFSILQIRIISPYQKEQYS